MSTRDYRPDEDADRFIQNAMVSANFGIDAEEAALAVREMLAAFRKCAAQLSTTDVKGKKAKCTCGAWVELPAGADVIARAAAHMAKGMDEVVRLSAFAQGRPDSRPGGGWADVLKVLTAEQVATVEGWLAAARER